MVQYLFEEKQLSYDDLCALDEDLDPHYKEMIAWRNGQDVK